MFDAGSNPVELGMVASLNRPGGKLTGVNQMVEELGTKQLGLLYELVPQAHVLGMLVDPNTSRAQNMVRNAQTAARVLGFNLEFLTAADEPDFDTAFTALTQQHIGGLFVAPAPFFYNRRDRIIALAARHAIPTLYVRRDFAAAGGVMSYGTSLVDTYRQIGIYAGRILKGEKPADLPVVQPTKFELVINLRTAKALGLDIPPRLFALANEVIE